MEKLKFEYFVNAEKKTVVCKMTVPENYVYTEVKNILAKNDFYGYYLEYLSKYCVGTVYKGVSKCHPEDTFDEKLGKRIAKLRALMKFNDEKKRFIDIVEEKAYSLLIDIRKAVDYSWHKYRDQDDELCELVYPEQDRYDDTNIVE